MARYNIPKINLVVELRTTDIENKMKLITKGYQEELTIFLDMLGEIEIKYNDYLISCTQCIQEGKDDLLRTLSFFIDEDDLEKLNRLPGLMPQCIRIEMK